MLLGEALALRSDVQKRMNRVQNLLLENATVQEGDTPVVEPTALLEEYRALAREHELLVRRIHRTNLQARLTVGGEDLSLADAVVRRERLAREASVLRDIASKATPGRSRFLRTEVKHVPTVDVAQVLADADRLSRAHRDLDTVMQQQNWSVELTE
jgi:hypothetical protein